MKNTIWKFPVPVANSFVISMPAEARILCLMTQDDALQLWALVDPERQSEQRFFRVVGTGHRIADASSLIYIGTSQVGPMVWHLFEAPR